MKASLVMTVIGLDRPGLVDSLSSVIAEHGGNWLGSRMSHLAGHFAGIVHVHVDRDREENLKQALGRLEKEGLSLQIQSEHAPAEAPAGRLMRLEVVGHDRPGIVSAISHGLAAQEINVEELNTDCSSAPMSGETLFKAEAILRVPEQLGVGEIRDRLQEIAGDLMIDLVEAKAETG